MRVVVITILSLLAAVSINETFALDSQIHTPPDLAQAHKAYTDAKALGHKASSLLQARNVYRLARKHYLKQPQKLAPHALSYAIASAGYGSKTALHLFEETLGIYVSAYGTDDQKLVPPLINAAEEALKQNEAEMAYAWFRRAGELLSQTTTASTFLARSKMGLAQLHANANEIEKAVTFARDAIENLDRNAADNSPIIAASILQSLGDIELAASNNLDALEAYEHALSLLKKHDSEAKEIYTLYTSLVAVNHKLGREKEASSNCLQAQNRQPRMHDARQPVYDPDGRLSALERPKQGQISATFVKGADCRLHNIEIHQAKGLTRAEAKALLSQAYFSPIIMNGKISNGEYASLARLQVYRSSSKK